MKVDRYNFRARIVPALVGILPIVALSWVAVPWNEISTMQIGAFATPLAICWLLADVARRLGKRTERKFFPSTGGQPFPDVLRHRSTKIDPVMKSRYHQWLGVQIEELPPSQSDEANDPATADAFYNRCGAFLREHVRGTDRAVLVHEENMTYGQRRNLYGLRWIALGFDAVVAAAGVWFLTAGEDVTGKPIEPSAAYILLSIALLHAAFFLFVVSKSAVEEASAQYGRQLVLTIETLSRRVDPT